MLSHIFHIRKFLKILSSLSKKKKTIDKRGLKRYISLLKYKFKNLYKCKVHSGVNFELVGCGHQVWA